MPFSDTANLSQSAFLPANEAEDPEQSLEQLSTADAAHNHSATPTKGQAVTFGLELEFNIAFTEQTLVSVLERHHINYNYIQKEHTDSGHSILLTAEDYSKDCRSQYPSWGVAMPPDTEHIYTNATLTSPSYTIACKKSGQRHQVRGYVSEPLLLAQDLMKQHNLLVDVHAIIRNLGINQPGIPLPGSAGPSDYLLCRFADYSKWTLTNDHTLIGNLKSQLMQHLPFKVTAFNVEDWDSHGIELVSPVFQLDQKDQAIAELSSRLAALASPSVDIVPSIWAGLHVHVGFNAAESSDLSLKTLQHLAYILLVHEDLITSLFPTHCSGLEPQTSEPEEPEDAYEGMSEEEFEKECIRVQAGFGVLDGRSGSESSTGSCFTDSSTSFSTNTNFNIDTPLSEGKKDHEKERQVLAAEKGFTNHQNKLSNARYLASHLDSEHPVPPKTIAEAVFSTTSIPELVHLLQKEKNDRVPSCEVYRGYMYNFSNILNFYHHGTGKPTVEFRQHECCIDAKKVWRWVKFVEGLVRKAEEMTKEHEPLTNVLHFQEVEVFCRWIKLDADDRRYWIERHDSFRKT